MGRTGGKGFGWGGMWCFWVGEDVVASLAGVFALWKGLCILYVMLCVYEVGIFVCGGGVVCLLRVRGGEGWMIRFAL